MIEETKERQRRKELREREAREKEENEARKREQERQRRQGNDSIRWYDPYGIPAELGSNGTGGSSVPIPWDSRLFV